MVPKRRWSMIPEGLLRVDGYAVIPLDGPLVDLFLRRRRRRLWNMSFPC
jgi:hypothetical protein